MQLTTCTKQKTQNSRPQPDPVRQRQEVVLPPRPLDGHEQRRTHGRHHRQGLRGRR